MRRDPGLCRFYRRKLAQQGMGKGRMAAARKLCMFPVSAGFPDGDKVTQIDFNGTTAAIQFNQ